MTTTTEHLAAVHDARDRTSVNNPLNPHVDWLLGHIERLTAADHETRACLAAGVLGWPTASSLTEPPTWETIAAEVRCRLELATVNGYSLSRVVFDLYDAGALHLRCTMCGTEEMINPDEDIEGPYDLSVAFDRVAEWAAGHVKTCSGDA